jgi:hypothetical protein
MGGDFTIECLGDDVLHKLNEVFGNPNSHAYKHARAHNQFGNVKNEPGNYDALVKAYEAAGVKVKDFGRWEAYLRVLGTVVPQGPANIHAIAQARLKALNANEGMSTIVHEPKNGGHVRTKPGTGIDPHVIDSPCPMSQPPKKY